MLDKRIPARPPQNQPLPTATSTKIISNQNSKVRQKRRFKECDGRFKLKRCFLIKKMNT